MPLRLPPAVFQPFSRKYRSRQRSALRERNLLWISPSVLPPSPISQSFWLSSAVQGASASWYFGPILPMVCLRWLKDRCLRLPLNRDVSATSSQLNPSSALRRSVQSSNSEYWGFPPREPSSSSSRSFGPGGGFEGVAAGSRNSTSRRAWQVFRFNKD